MPQHRPSFGWRKRLSVDSRVLVASVAYPMIAEQRLGKDPAAIDGADPILAEIADELNSHLGSSADPQEMWTAQRVRQFLISTQASVARQALEGPGEPSRRRPLAIIVKVDDRSFTDGPFKIYS